ncbi:hypothetical protein CY34DRAFT_810597 [Suillus luteus UH-Slu-Lm8-n1]|uniref:Uncharacterized protein n=1 Tax=Suillus luteus UH-Slu-Lm8-n1 TaxID=930992 RepID=A0A0D0ASD5_9AGAM|nr:hypothetical protein CY34DRAFT_810597 [Suillus luteus UH-Slu-Lm8-n1]
MLMRCQDNAPLRKHQPLRSVTDMEWLLMDLAFVANLARINDDVFLTAWHRLHFPMVPG